MVSLLPPIVKKIGTQFGHETHSKRSQYDQPGDVQQIAAEESTVKYKSKEHLKKDLGKLRKSMDRAVKELDFMEAARIRDLMAEIQKKISE